VIAIHCKAGKGRLPGARVDDLFVFMGIQCLILLFSRIRTDGSDDIIVSVVLRGCQDGGRGDAHVC
jgi:hypothetical protein